MHHHPLIFIFSGLRQHIHELRYAPSTSTAAYDDLISHPSY
jgi:hypothetical protein